jgi:hypothetical protein
MEGFLALVAWAELSVAAVRQPEQRRLDAGWRRHHWDGSAHRDRDFPCARSGLLPRSDCAYGRRPLNWSAGILPARVSSYPLKPTRCPIDFLSHMGQKIWRAQCGAMRRPSSSGANKSPESIVDETSELPAEEIGLLVVNLQTFHAPIGASDRWSWKRWLVSFFSRT